MSNYSVNPAMVRVDFFKPSGKWYDTVAVEWQGYHHSDIYQALRNSLNTSGYGDKYSGMTAVCLEPYHENAHPLMIVNW